MAERVEYDVRCANGDVGVHSFREHSYEVAEQRKEYVERSNALTCGPHSVVTRTVTYTSWVPVA